MLWEAFSLDSSRHEQAIKRTAISKIFRKSNVRYLILLDEAFG